jgi:hypothetical protein
MTIIGQLRIAKRNGEVYFHPVTMVGSEPSRLEVLYMSFVVVSRILGDSQASGEGVALGPFDKEDELYYKGKRAFP